ncbi:hypothetical protein EMIHUDRAFT_453634 [Emiliania huxleyi CCMP1516]|uniref:Major facilitator superfamily (MFS) profile domain-containing protein n=2 Tax=Emiliania huxleyi TaxID=2903 RepID=A0A0D3I3I7_EMIH1|nr:hypothetical protein EMIHUDRAFT_453634 [Emiliania huxleyi CCMP1516]EOD05822.1 hypothetical protein EMIHUDRAFT_453634 [Emiliania huxleyi CCMP1516]|eukprot:XP_005758251.1 hypothetical protein EMIHUDRAFT_453634 [Emiliania huxleyi CCMP1516]
MNAAARARHNTVAVLTTVGIVNGGLVGGIGPSIDAFAANTGLSQSTLAGLVLQMKLSKLLGNYCWTYYANSSARHGRLSPRGLHAALMLCSAGLSCVVARARTSPRWLQLACWGFGLCYGCSDAGVLMALAVLAAAAAAVLACAAPLPRGDAASLPHYEALQPDSPGGNGLELQPLHEPGSTAQSSGDGRDGLGRSPLHRRHGLVLVGAMATVLFSVTAAEHGVATWLPTYGQRVGAMELSSLALLSSVFWAVVTAGRVAWSAFAASVSSAWHALAFDASVMVVSGLSYLGYELLQSQWLLWLGTCGLGIAIASSVPAAMALPAEGDVIISPNVMLVFNFAMSLGELLAPYTIGLCFAQGWYGAFTACTVMMSLAVAGATAVARCTLVPN